MKENCNQLILKDWRSYNDGSVCLLIAIYIWGHHWGLEFKGNGKHGKSHSTG